MASPNFVAPPPIVIEMAVWKRICAEHPTLQTQKFRVGSV